MALHGLFPLLEQVPAYREARDALFAPKAPNTPITMATPDAARGYVLAALAQGSPWTSTNDHEVKAKPKSNLKDADVERALLVVVTARPEDAQHLVDELEVYLGPESSDRASGADPTVLLFPAGETLPFERLAGDEVILHARLRVLAALRAEAPGIIVTSVAALMQRTLAQDEFLSACHTLRTGQRIQTDPLLTRWASLGYAIESAVEVPGTASRRGGILDIYPSNAPLPLRIELWGDVIESIRFFDPVTQRSQAEVDFVQVVPAREVLPALANRDSAKVLTSQLSAGGDGQIASLERIEEEIGRLLAGSYLEEAAFYTGFFSAGCLLDYLPPDAVLVMDDLQRIRQAGEELEERVATLRHVKEGRGELPKGFPSPLWPWPWLEERIKKAPRQLHLGVFGQSTGGKESGITPAPSFWGRLEAFAEGVRDRARQGGRVLALSHHAERLAEILRDHDVGAQVYTSLKEPPVPGDVALLSASPTEGFVLPLASGPLVVFTDAEIFGRSKRRRPIRRQVLRREAFLSELTPGAFVVHVDHGIARFAGTQRVTAEQGEKEYLTLEFAEGDRLFVPTESLDRISPYFSPGEAAPNLTRLGTQEWGRAKERARSSAREMAQELVALYAARQVLPGHAFPSESPWQRELEDAFPYVETPDQLTAIQEVKEAMEQPHPMDRLVCGDVGYGKTEVALRAAFKAVQDNKQVALLCPTTVLAQQHYATFTERLSPFPVKVEVLSRFRPEHELRQVVEGLKSGAVDIAIGTHRLIQKDVSFKDLGLVIIDDEQRFGVAQKERFKQFRREVDVLTMTATPIPRTLYMALSSIRDMSTIHTPPESRQPVLTFVSEYSDDLVQEAILRELDRGGQVFFVHNRIRDIAEWANRIQELAPQARVAIGHGRMDEEELATVMADFVQGKIDVLVCTTIIEAGLDMPNVNTLVVHRPELLGLAQMYQLRGRVGRGAHRAYASFLVPQGKRLTEAANQRLKAILAHQELGAGFRIAMRDLEIRGAGNLLGQEQSGHIHAIGFDLYCRLLEEAVEELKGSGGESQRPPASPQVAVNLPLTAYIPEEYIEDLPQRLGVYQRLARTTTTEEATALDEELRDRYGPLSEPVENLLYVVRVKLLAGVGGVESVAREGDHIALRLREPVGGARPVLQKELATAAHVGDLLIRVPLRGRWTETLTWTLEGLVAFRERVMELAQTAG